MLWFRTFTRLALLLLVASNVGCSGAVSNNAADDANEGASGAAGSSTNGGGKSGSAGSDPGAAGSTGSVSNFAPAVLRIARLTRAEYENSIRDLFGAAVAADSAKLLGRDLSTDDSIAIGAREVAVARSGVVNYADAAEAIAARAVGSATFKTTYGTCQPSSPKDTACAKTIVNNLGLRLFRRPLTTVESDRYTAVATKVSSEANDFWKGIQFALAGLQVSPNFTHRIEIGEMREGRLAFTGYEMAGRISYLLWGSTPDNALLSAAKDLVTPAGLAIQVDRLLKESVRLRAGVRSIFDDVLSLQTIEGASKDLKRFPMDSPDLRTSMREATLKLAESLFVEKERPLVDIYDPGIAFVDRLTAPFYGAKAPASGFEQITLPATGLRTGILTEPSILAAYAGAALTSPTLRGKFIRSRLLCSPIPPPPANVNNNLPATITGTTRREQIQSHMTNPTCAGCHKAMDPLGFALENFDALGFEQTKDNGVTVDASGDLDGVAFKNVRDLSRLLKQDPNSAECFMNHLFAHVSGRLITDADDAPLKGLGAVYKQNNGKLVPLLRALALSDAFRFAEPSP